MASAEGISLFTTGLAIAPCDVARDLGERTALKQAFPITLNKAALDSKVIAVRFEGETRRYIGTKKHTAQGETWNGRAADGSPLWLGWSQSGVLGQIVMARRMFLIVHHAGESILAEVDRDA